MVFQSPQHELIYLMDRFLSCNGEKTILFSLEEIERIEAEKTQENEPKTKKD